MKLSVLTDRQSICQIRTNGVPEKSVQLFLSDNFISLALHFRISFPFPLPPKPLNDGLILETIRAIKPMTTVTLRIVIGTSNCYNDFIYQLVILEYKLSLS